MASGIYTVVAQAQTIATAITVLELTAPSTGEIELYRAWCQQSSTTTSAMVRIELLRKSGTITGTASPPAAVPTEVGMPATGATIKWKATGEGTDGVILIEEAYNLLNGWLWLPVPEERIKIPPSGVLGMKFPAAPTSASYTFGFVWREYG